MSFIDLDEGRGGFLSAPTQRNTLRDQNPKGQLCLWAVLYYGVLSVYPALKLSDRQKQAMNGNVEINLIHIAKLF